MQKKLRELSDGFSAMSLRKDHERIILEGYVINESESKFDFQNSLDLDIKKNFGEIILQNIKLDVITFSCEINLNLLDNDFILSIKNNINNRTDLFGVPKYFNNLIIPDLNYMKKIGCDDKDWFVFSGFTLFLKLKKVFNDLGFDSKNSKIIDLGGGLGRVSQHFKQKKYDVEIYDTDQELNNFTNSINIVSKNNLSEAKTESVDIIFSHSLIPHLDEKELKKIFLECDRILKPNGIMCMSNLSNIALLYEPVNETQIFKFLNNLDISVNQKNFKFHYAMQKTKSDFPNYYQGNFYTLETLKQNLTSNLNFYDNITGYSHHHDLVIIKKVK